MSKNNSYIKIIIVLFSLIAINFIGRKVYKRFDLTQDQRYTLSDETKEIIEDIEDPIAIKVYLEGDFPAEFKRIQLETKQHLKELNSLNDQIQFRFVNPLTKQNELIKKGLQPSRLSVEEDGQVSQTIIFPYAEIIYKDKSDYVSLLSNAVAGSQEEQLLNSIENLEYAFSDAILKLTSEKNKKIAILRGNGELEDIYLYSYLKQLGEYYHLAEFTLDSIERDPQKTLQDLRYYDMAIIAKPTQSFSENEKFALDQFITNGGKTLWMIDQVYADMDSIMQDGKMMIYNRDLKLTDLLFQYGVRINYDITKDLYSSTIRLASGNTGNQTQFQDFTWPYFPLIVSKNDHPVSTNLDPILLKFPSSIDTLKNDIKKTVLLQSSDLAKPLGTPVEVSLNEITQKQLKKNYTNGNKIFGVLLEGNFKSAYADRVKPFEIDNFKKENKNKMVIISDGDIIANEVFRGEPLDLSKDKFTNQRYGNKEFLMNTTHYLLDDSGILNLRSKNLQIQFLDKQKAYSERGFWQIFNLILPLVFLLIFGIIFKFIRKRKYALRI
ncbi:MAG: gliding motility-associated ABC transporter substrate-binding protein GldG [Bacteroidota bacterium]